MDAATGLLLQRPDRDIPNGMSRDSVIGEIPAKYVETKRFG